MRRACACRIIQGAVTIKTLCFALELRSDPQLVEEYKRYRQPGVIWPEIVNGIRTRGVLNEELFLLGDRLVMVLRTTDDFDLSIKRAVDAASPVSQRWEQLMWTYQQLCRKRGRVKNGFLWKRYSRSSDST
jgi:L-rhamnose mutarotase